MNSSQLTASRFFVFVFIGLMTAFAIQIALLPKYSATVLISVEGTTVLDSAYPVDIAGRLREMFMIQTVGLRTEPVYTLTILSPNHSMEPNKTIIEITVKARDEASAVLIANGIADIFCRNSYELAVPSIAQQLKAQQVAGKRRAIRRRVSISLPGKNFQIIERATLKKVQPISEEIHQKIMNGTAISFGIALILAFYMWCVQCGRASLSNALNHPAAKPL